MKYTTMRWQDIPFSEGFLAAQVGPFDILAQLSLIFVNEFESAAGICIGPKYKLEVKDHYYIFDFTLKNEKERALFIYPSGSSLKFVLQWDSISDTCITYDSVRTDEIVTKILLGFKKFGSVKQIKKIQPITELIIEL